MTGCELCQQTGGVLVAKAGLWRVIRAEDADFPAFYRVVWNAHVQEFSELSVDERALCMDVVCRVEAVLRDKLAPTKINLAALGNVVPHLHWHVIARFDWDSHFPKPVWAAGEREVDPPAIRRLPVSLDELDGAVRDAVQPLLN